MVTDVHCVIVITEFIKIFSKFVKYRWFYSVLYGIDMSIMDNAVSYQKVEPMRFITSFNISCRTGILLQHDMTISHTAANYYKHTL